MVAFVINIVYMLDTVNRKSSSLSLMKSTKLFSIKSFLLIQNVLVTCTTSLFTVNLNYSYENVWSYSFNDDESSNNDVGSVGGVSVPRPLIWDLYLWSLTVTSIDWNEQSNVKVEIFLFRVTVFDSLLVLYVLLNPLCYKSEHTIDYRSSSVFIYSYALLLPGIIRVV